MSKSQIELQVQQTTQRAIHELQQNMMQLDNTARTIDANMRQSHMSLAGNLTQVTLRLNFIMNELKSKLSEEELKEFEERFKEFAISEHEKMQKEISEQVKKQEEKQKAREEAEKNKKDEPKIIS